MSTIVPEIDDIVNFFRSDIVEEIARETGFTQRESKLGGIEFLGIMTAGLFAFPDASLGRMCSMANDITPGIEISKPGMHQRIDESGIRFLKKLLSVALEISSGLSSSRDIDADMPKLFQAFSRVCLLDNTHIPLPDVLSSIWRGSGCVGTGLG